MRDCRERGTQPNGCSKTRQLQEYPFFAQYSGSLVSTPRLTHATRTLETILVSNYKNSKERASLSAVIDIILILRERNS